MEIVWNTPNRISAVRIALGAAFLALLVAGRPTDAAWALLAAMLTDVIDGAVARRTDQVTAFGIALDAAADRFVLGLGFTLVTALHGFPLWAGVLFVTYHVGMSIGYVALLRGKRPAFEHVPVAKAAATFQTAVIFGALLGLLDHPAGETALVIAAALTVIAAAEYAGMTHRTLRR